MSRLSAVPVLDFLRTLPPGDYSPQDITAFDEALYSEARENFWSFRCLIDPSIKRGWFQWEVAGELQRFYYALKRGERPILVFSAPPQHGKSRTVRDFTAWVMGQDPNLKTIFASFSGELGAGTNLYLQRLMDSEVYRRIFPDTQLAASTDSERRNSTLLECVRKIGSFRNTTVEGQINGQGLDLGLVDDPIKGRAEAQSKTVRDSTWNWMTDDFFARFADGAGMIMIMTRWHKDDTTGRWIERFPNTRMLVYPAIAINDEAWRKKGEALFPEHKSLDFLMMRKSLMTRASWESIYQQNPIVVGGGIFPIDKFRIVPVAPGQRIVRKTVRYWDKAGTKDGGAYSCGVLLHDMADGTGVTISDVRRGQWSYREREVRIKQTAEMDRATWGPVENWIEQEPGSGGKESAESTIVNLRGFTVHADKVTGSKESRSEPYAAQVQAGNVALVAGEWNREFIDEHENYPTGPYKDQIDAAAGAFNKAVRQAYGDYDTSMAWVDGPMAS